MITCSLNTRTCCKVHIHQVHSSTIIYTILCYSTLKNNWTTNTSEPPEYISLLCMSSTQKKKKHTPLLKSLSWLCILLDYLKLRRSTLSSIVPCCLALEEIGTSSIHRFRKRTDYALVQWLPVSLLKWSQCFWRMYSYCVHLGNWRLTDGHPIPIPVKRSERKLAMKLCIIKHNKILLFIYWILKN